MLENTNFTNNLHKDILKLCHSLRLRPHNSVRGCKLFDNYQRVAILVLHIRSGKALRTFCEEFSETKWRHWLQLKKLPKKSTLHSWLQLFSVSFIRNLIRFSLENPNPDLVAIDGSGIEADHKTSYYKHRIGFEPKSPWHKLDIICDVQGSKQIIDFSFLVRNQHDSKVANKIFKRLKIKDSVIVADKGYFSFAHLENLNEKDIDLIFPPKEYGKTKHNAFKHKKIKQKYYKNKELYDKRNNVESVFSSLKRVQGLKMRSRIQYMKKREMAWNILWYNIRKKLSYLIFLIEKSIKFQINFENILKLNIGFSKIKN